MSNERTTYETALSPDALALIPAGPHAFLTPNETSAACDLPSGTRPRMYGYAERGTYAGQIVAIRSHYDLERNGDTLGAVWVSGTTLADLVRQA